MRVIIVHSLEQAHAALETAATLDLPLTLQTAPDALFYAGSRYLLNLFTQAQAAFPQVQAELILDCGEAGAEAIIAMQTGHCAILSCAAPDMQKKLRSIAEAYSVRWIESACESLDLATERDPHQACRDFLLRH